MVTFAVFSMDSTTVKAIEPPIADFSWSPSTPDEGAVVQFTDLSTDPDDAIVSWLWQFGDGGTSSLTYPSHAYGDNGLYQVTLTVTDAMGLQDSITKSLTTSNVPPDAHINSPLIFTMTQGSMTVAIPPVERAEDMVSFYDYYSASSHTGFEKAYESKVFLYRDTVANDLHLIMTHDIDNGPSTLSEVYFDLSGIPAGAYVSQSDDTSHCWDPPRCEEFSLDYPDREGQWRFFHNTDGGVLSGLPLDIPWCITVTPQHWVAIDRWVYHFASGDAIELDMNTHATIFYTPPPVPPDDVTIEEGGEVSLSGFFDDPGWEDVHNAKWYFGDGTREDATFSQRSFFTLYDVDPVVRKYADDGIYAACLVAEDDDTGVGSLCINVTVENVAPVISSLTSRTTNIGETISYDAMAIDPGSDDLTVLWNWGDGTPDSVTEFLNNGVSQDPYQSSGGTYPFSATDRITHIYENTGSYIVTLTVVDDDGGETVTTASVAVTAPDLIPWDVRVNGIPYVDSVHAVLGSEVDISVKAKNVGTGEAVNWFYLNLIDSTTLRLIEVQGLEVGEISAEPLTHRLSATAPGIYRVYIAVDSANDVMEEDESNNWLRLDVVVEGPDLIPEEIEIDGEEYISHVEMEPGDTITISLLVANIGTHSNGKPSMIAFYFGEKNEYPILIKQISELDIEERSLRITMDWSAPSKEGEYSIIFVADYDDDVRELNEENNVAEIRLEVKAAPESEPNNKPLIALLFTLILAIFGGVLAFKKPLDISLPIRKGNGREANLKRKELGKKTIQEKLLILEEEELIAKFSRDRLLTTLLL
ncbi:MAG: PKD domain-containing protein, partial [Methanobacteriota archaeon]